MLASVPPSDSSAEWERLTALANMAIMDTPSEREFDELTRLAAKATGAASCAISLVDDRRQWFKASCGISFSETDRDIAFCTHAIIARDLLVVPDTCLDPRFQSNPLVTCEGGIRFYAGAPLVISSGHCLGTLCVFDPAPREGITSEQAAILTGLARVAADLIEARRYRQVGEIAAQVVDVTSDAVVCANVAGEITFWNKAAEVMFGYPADRALGSDLSIMMPGRFAADHQRGFDQVVSGGVAKLEGGTVELVGEKADGSEFPIELSLSRWGSSAAEQGFAAIVRDISTRKVLERERDHARAFLGTVVANLPAMLFVKDVTTRKYLLVNEAGAALIGRPAETVLGRTDRELFPRFGDAYEQRDSDVIAANAARIFESEFVRDDGAKVRLRTRRVVVDGPDRPAQYILGLSEDVTEVRRAEAEILRLAHYDTLTGLMNRASYANRLHQLVQAGASFAMLSIDLDRFKAVNDRFGHPAGDKVLSEVGSRLRSLIADQDHVARTGGDEFVMIIAGPALRDRAYDLGMAIVGALSEPFITKYGVAHSGASVGIVLAPDDGETTGALRQSADLALYRAKAEGRGSVCFFSAAMDAAARDRRVLEQDLRNAIATNAINLAYQPVLAVESGQVTSCEALARWTHHERGPVSPDVFIPLAEDCGLIDELGRTLLRQACSDAMTWPQAIRVAVNLSPLQFQSGKLCETVAAILEETGLRTDRLQLEVTEGLLIRDVDRTFAELERLRRLGIQILMDDFGTGYSSLSYFERFPFDKVKIDKSFVDGIATSRAASAIIRAVIGLGEQLGMGVVAEGVETDEQMKLLVAAGCTHLQGYLFSKPLEASAIRRMLADGRRGETHKAQAA